MWENQSNLSPKKSKTKGGKISVINIISVILLQDKRRRRRRPPSATYESPM
ncbi:hypothetical protein QFZ51_003307 [Chitinophaga sp. W3I9]